MKISLTYLTILLSTQFLLAQSLTKEKELIVTAGPSMSKLINTNIDKDEYKVVDKQPGLNFQFSYNRYFKDRFGFGYWFGLLQL